MAQVEDYVQRRLYEYAEEVGRLRMVLTMMRDQNGSLPKAYRDMIDTALATSLVQTEKAE